MTNIHIISIILGAFVYLILVVGTKRLASAFRRKIIITYTTLHLVGWCLMHFIAQYCFFYPHHCFSPVPFVLIAKVDERFGSALHIYAGLTLKEILRATTKGEGAENFLTSIRKYLPRRPVNPYEYLFHSPEFTPLGGREGFIKMPDGWSHTQSGTFQGDEGCTQFGKIRTLKGVLINYEFWYDPYSSGGTPEMQMHKMLMSQEIKWSKTNVIGRVTQYVYLTKNRELVCWHIYPRLRVAGFSAVLDSNASENVEAIVAVLNTFRFPY
jgi:hypothetical protein